MAFAPGMKGAGQVVTTAFSVPVGSLEFWRNRLRVAGVASNDIEAHFGEPAIAFNDPSGLRFELIANDRDTRAAWTGIVGKGSAIRGLHSVIMEVQRAQPSIDFLINVLGYHVVGTSGGRTRMAAGGDAPGHLIDVLEQPDAKPAVNGVGTVHHVAMAIGSDEEQVTLRDDLLAAGVRVTDIRDRSYFRSIYFREPGGVLFEVATVQPGFAVDEAGRATLGRGPQAAGVGRAAPRLDRGEPCAGNLRLIVSPSPSPKPQVPRPKSLRAFALGFGGAHARGAHRTAAGLVLIHARVGGDDELVNGHAVLRETGAAGAD